MRNIKSFETFNESIRDKMKGKTDEEIQKILDSEDGIKLSMSQIEYLINIDNLMDAMPELLEMINNLDDYETWFEDLDEMEDDKNAYDEWEIGTKEFRISLILGYLKNVKPYTYYYLTHILGLKYK